MVMPGNKRRRFFRFFPFTTSRYFCILPHCKSKNRPILGHSLWRQRPTCPWCAVDDLPCLNADQQSDRIGISKMHYTLIVCVFILTNCQRRINILRRLWITCVNIKKQVDNSKKFSTLPTYLSPVRLNNAPIRTIIFVHNINRLFS